MGVPGRRGDRVPGRMDRHARHLASGSRASPPCTPPSSRCPSVPRRTGFLIPRLGYGSHDGFAIRQPFFWAISRSQDATLTPIYRTKRGFELDGEYRYVLDERSRGDFRGRYLHDLGPASAPPNRGEAHWVHDQVLSPTWTLQGGCQLPDDRTVNRAFVENPTAQRTQATRPTPSCSSPRRPPVPLHRAGGGVTRICPVRRDQLAGAGAGGAISSGCPPRPSGCRWWRRGTPRPCSFQQTDATSTGRFDLYPALHLPLSLSPWLTSATSVGLRETAYTASNQGGGGANRLLFEVGQRAQQPPSRGDSTSRASGFSASDPHRRTQCGLPVHPVGGSGLAAAIRPVPTSSAARIG